MKFSVLSFLVLFITTNIFAQSIKPANNKFQTFTRTSISYVFGINETSLQEKTNSLHVKLVIGLSNPKVGFGIGLENASFRAAGGNKGASFEALSFNGNAHFLAKPIYTDELNYFIKGAAGYAPKIFSGYNKGFNYEAATGVLLTTKRKSKYFLQAIYHYQEIDGFVIAAGKPKIKALGLGIGAWF